MVILEDFVKGCLRMNLREKKATLFVKVVALVLGIVALCFLYVVERMGGVLGVSNFHILNKIICFLRGE